MTEDEMVGWHHQLDVVVCKLCCPEAWGISFLIGNVLFF